MMVFIIKSLKILPQSMQIQAFSHSLLFSTLFLVLMCDIPCSVTIKSINIGYYISLV